MPTPLQILLDPVSLTVLGLYANNYSDLPLFDLLFGTFKNPKDFAAEQGFYEGASARVVDLLRWRDVANAPLGRTQPLSHGS